jgi:hypothetical protein
LGEAHALQISPRDLFHGQQLFEEGIGFGACAADFPISLPAQMAAATTVVFKREQRCTDESIIVQKMQIFVEAYVALFIHKCIISELRAEAQYISLRLALSLPEPRKSYAKPIYSLL